MSLATSGMIFARQAEYVEESSRQRRALYDLAARTIQGPAIIFIHGFLGSRLIFAEEDAIRNSPFLDGRILYAHDLGARNRELIEAYPGCEYYRGTYDGLRQRPKLESIPSK
jgi:pimeloyl-ACP methyl ester carboxylesterase